MSVNKQWVPLLTFITVAFLWWLTSPSIITTIQNAGRQIQPRQGWVPKPVYFSHFQRPDEETPLHPPIAEYKPGTPKAPGSGYTRTIVMAKTTNEDTTWVTESFAINPLYRLAIYHVSDPLVGLHTPTNKGHEVMTYLSFIIAHYYNLSDINIFVHAHRKAWHNNELLGYDNVVALQRLSDERVVREGFVNLRCVWDPGCPEWMRPGVVEEDVNKQEEAQIARSWLEIFPQESIPKVLAQPCCAQFAISRERIQVLPLARYLFFRDWLLRTSLSDYISGRVWEYLWQYIFTGQHIVCPMESICYCDGFGICFGGEDKYQDFADHLQERKKLEEDLKTWERHDSTWKGSPNSVERPEPGVDAVLRGEIAGLSTWIEDRLEGAKAAGDQPENRAKEAGRKWKEGDGF